MISWSIVKLRISFCQISGIFASRQGTGSMMLKLSQSVNKAKYPTVTKHTAKLQAYWLVLLLHREFPSTRMATDGEDSRKVHFEKLKVLARGSDALQNDMAFTE